jgi:hypothetical protein
LLAVWCFRLGFCTALCDISWCKKGLYKYIWLIDLRHGAVHYHAETWWQRMNGMTMGLRISSRYLCVQISINKMQLCSMSVAYASVTMGTMLTSANCLLTLRHTCGLRLCRPVRQTSKSSKTTLETVYGR